MCLWNSNIYNSKFYLLILMIRTGQASAASWLIDTSSSSICAVIYCFPFRCASVRHALPSSSLIDHWRGAISAHDPHHIHSLRSCITVLFLTHILLVIWKSKFDSFAVDGEAVSIGMIHGLLQYILCRFHGHDLVLWL